MKKVSIFVFSFLLFFIFMQCSRSSLQPENNDQAITEAVDLDLDLTDLETEAAELDEGTPEMAQKFEKAYGLLKLVIRKAKKIAGETDNEDILKLMGDAKKYQRKAKHLSQLEKPKYKKAFHFVRLSRQAAVQAIESATGEDYSLRKFKRLHKRLMKREEKVEALVQQVNAILETPPVEINEDLKKLATSANTHFDAGAKALSNWRLNRAAEQLIKAKRRAKKFLANFPDLSGQTE